MYFTVTTGPGLLWLQNHMFTHPSSKMKTSERALTVNQRLRHISLCCVSNSQASNELKRGRGGISRLSNHVEILHCHLNDNRLFTATEHQILVLELPRHFPGSNKSPIIEISSCMQHPSPVALPSPLLNLLCSSL